MSKYPAPLSRSRCNWTADEEQLLRDQWGLVPDATLARKLGRTVTALIMRATRLHLGGRSANYYSCRQAGAALGVDSHTVRSWIDAGELPADRPIFLPGRCRPRAWRILPAALETFVRSHPERLDLRRMPPGYLRSLLTKAVPLSHVSRTRRPWTSHDDAYLINHHSRQTYPALGVSLNRSPGAVHARLKWLRKAGRLVPYKGPWRTTRQRNGTATKARPWTTEEDRYIQTHWGRLRTPEEPTAWGFRVTSADIAAHLGRTRMAVESRASRLGCKNPGWHPGVELQHEEEHAA